LQFEATLEKYSSSDRVKLKLNESPVSVELHVSVNKGKVHSKSWFWEVEHDNLLKSYLSWR